MSDVIRFYSASGPHGELSNFAPAVLVLNGVEWRTSEHLFQAAKFWGTRHASDIRKAGSPGEAARMGRDRHRPLRPHWEQVKNDVMRVCVGLKFQQNPDLAIKLLQTGDARLIEHTENDRYWADGGNGSGKNMLGKILMEVRQVLKEGQRLSIETYIVRANKSCQLFSP